MAIDFKIGQEKGKAISVLACRPSRHRAFRKAHLKAPMSRQEAESFLRSINQLLKAAKESFVRLTVFLSILKTSFDLDCSPHVRFKITEGSLLSALQQKKQCHI